MIQTADRLRKLPPYLFAEIDQKKREVRARGVDVIDLGIGDPDLPTPPHIIRALQQAAEKPEHHRYPSYEGTPAFRHAVADWYARRFGVTLDPDTEVLTLIGSKEGTAHMPLAFVNPGDVVLVPDPGYPVYAAGTWFAGGECHFMPLRRPNGFLPDLGAIPPDVARRAKLMYLNYPNNPTAAVASPAFFEKVVEFARRYDVIVCHDAMYSELRFDDYVPPSFLSTPGAREVGVGPHHMSRVFHAETGQTLSSYRDRLRVRRALERIDAGADNLAQVAADLGFADHAHLTRAVRAELGCTPTQVRQQLLQIRERSSHQSSNARSPSTLTRSSSGPRRP